MNNRYIVIFDATPKNQISPRHLHRKECKTLHQAKWWATHFFKNERITNDYYGFKSCVYKIGYEDCGELGGTSGGYYNDSGYIPVKYRSEY